MLLDKLERHTAYIIMLQEFRDHRGGATGSWFCYLVWDLFRIEDAGFSDKRDYYSIARVLGHFPELDKLMRLYFPEHEDYELRERILNICIEETY